MPPCSGASSRKRKQPPVAGTGSSGEGQGKSRLIDLSGLRFGRLLVLERAGINSHNHPLWLSLCDCGNTKKAQGENLRDGVTKSCGCLSAELSKRRMTKHGLAKSPVFRAWIMMRQRCTNKSNKSYHNYGGRGIKVCKRWLNSFENFYKDVGSPPSPNHQIDRIDNDGDYTPKNCKWSTQVEQNNNRRSNHFIFACGKRGTIAQFSRLFGIKPATIRRRLSVGWDADIAVTLKP